MCGAWRWHYFSFFNYQTNMDMLTHKNCSNT
jgi:hypothetical protein